MNKTERNRQRQLCIFCFESMRERYCMLTLSRPINILRPGETDQHCLLDMRHFQLLVLACSFATTNFFKHFMFGKHILHVGKQMLLVLCLLASFAIQSWLLAKLASKSDQAPNTDVGQTMLASFARPLLLISQSAAGAGRKENCTTCEWLLS